MKNGQKTLIIGGGVIGLAIARELHKRGLTDITVLEKGRIGEEASWAAAGMLSPQVDADQEDAFFRFCCGSRDIYPQFAAELFEETGVDIELDRTGTLYLSFDDVSGRRLLDRYRWQRDAGLGVESLNVEEILKLEPNVSSLVRTGLLFPNDWQVENRKLLAALTRYAELNGIELRPGVEVTDVTVEDHRAISVVTREGSLGADVVILATGAWTSLIKLECVAMPFSVEPVRGQIVAFDSPERLFAHVVQTVRGYLVPRRDGRILAGATTENVGFDKATTEQAAEEMRSMASEIAPDLSTLPIVDHWAGLRPYAADALPVIGPVDGVQGAFVATAHYRNGILLAPATASLIADRVAGSDASSYLEEFSPSRFSRLAATCTS